MLDPSDKTFWIRACVMDYFDCLFAYNQHIGALLHAVLRAMFAPWPLSSQKILFLVLILIDLSETKRQLSGKIRSRNCIIICQLLIDFIP